MNWEKKGLIYNSDGRFGWNLSHAQLPVADAEQNGCWRIYYATRNSKGESNIGFIDVECNNPSNILYVHPEPVLPMGKLGTFDESGLMPVALVNRNKRKYLYYAGWSLKKTVPYHNTIGLAISDDGGMTFKKLGEGPLFDAIPFEPYSTGTINVLIENGIWKAWYQSITHWQLINHRPEPFYHLKYAESADGISWKREGKITIDYKNAAEAGICSASVITDGSMYRMWYCYRGNVNYRKDLAASYRIGYAESNDGMEWIRRDEYAGIGLSSEGWDSEMIAYPNILVSGKIKYMFYNGNGFGRSGFGYALLDS